MSQAIDDLLKLFRRTVRSGRDMSIEFQVGRFLSRGGSTQFYFDAGLCARVSKVCSLRHLFTHSHRRAPATVLDQFSYFHLG
jgi:hypothetical protein